MQNVAGSPNDEDIRLNLSSSLFHSFPVYSSCLNAFYALCKATA